MAEKNDRGWWIGTLKGDKFKPEESCGEVKPTKRRIAGRTAMYLWGGQWYFKKPRAAS